MITAVTKIMSAVNLQHLRECAEQPKNHFNQNAKHSTYEFLYNCGRLTLVHNFLKLIMFGTDGKK
jgi:hypothetical protein